LLLLSFFMLAGWGAGTIWSAPWLGLCIGIGVWAVVQWVRLLRLRRWLSAGAPAVNAGYEGLWGDVYRGVTRLLQANSDDSKSHRRIRLEDAIVTLPYGIAIVDPNGCIEWLNPAACTLLNLSYEDDVGREITHLVRQPDFVRALESEDKISEVDLNMSDRSLTVYISSFNDGYHLIVAHDLSHTRYLERARSELLGNVAHELKIPLTVIGGYAEIAGDAAADATVDDALTHIVKQTRRMNRIIDDLLMLERLEEGALSAEDMEAVDVRHLADEVVQEATVAAVPDACTIEVDVYENASLYGNNVELHSMLSNLVDNAVRHSPQNGVVRVCCTRDDDGIHLSVSDQGAGIDAVHLPRLTERFYRVDKSRSRESGGTGLGLAIVKRVLRRHGAQLRIHSTPGTGSVFYCDFPNNTGAAN